MKKLFKIYFSSAWIPTAVLIVFWFGLMTLNFAFIDYAKTYSSYAEPIMLTLGFCFILLIGILVASLYQFKSKLWVGGVINLVVVVGLSFYLFLHKSAPIQFYDQSGEVEQLIETAYTHHSSGNKIKAWENIDMAYKINPYDSRIYLTRANLYRDEKTFDRALVEYGKAIKLDDYYSVWAYNNRGRLYAELGRYKEALEDLNVAVEIDPQEKAYSEYRDYVIKKLGESQ
ncbi:MAG: tetratricopeptide (TPR) repeat protein [Candidatus Omnitrophota bacterium]|jgi:tetratricopeptide (TPR) repeat protein